MIPSGLYFINRNDELQIYATRLGAQIYASDVTTVPYFKSSSTQYMVYVGYALGLGTSATLTVRVGSQAAVTTHPLDATGLYVVRCNSELGRFTVNTTLPDGTILSKAFWGKNLSLLNYTHCQLLGTTRQQFLTLLANSFCRQHDDGGVFPGTATATALENNFGNMIGFSRPAEWSAAQYQAALGGVWSDGIVSTDSSVLALTVTVLTTDTLAGYVLGQLPTGSSVQYRGKSFSALSAQCRIAITAVEASPYTHSALFTCVDDATGLIYVLFREDLTSADYGTYYVGVDVLGTVVVQKSDNGIVPTNILPLWSFVFTGVSSVATAVLSDLRTFTTTVNTAGVIAALGYGGTRGATADVIASITGYRPTLADFRVLHDEGTWILPVDTATVWTPSTAYALGAYATRIAGGDVWMCVKAGTSGTTLSSTILQVGDYFTDGTVEWLVVQYGQPLSWVTGRTYAAGDRVSPTSGHTDDVFVCMVAGTAGSSEPTWPSVLNATVSDGAATLQLSQLGIRTYSDPTYTGLAGDVLSTDDSPVVLNWGKLWGGTEVVRIIFDGFSRSEQVYRAATGQTDALSQSWLNPFPSTSSTIVQYLQKFTGVTTLTLDHPMSGDAEQVYLGSMLLVRNQDYEVIDEYNISILVTVGTADVISVFYTSSEMSVYRAEGTVSSTGTDFELTLTAGVLLSTRTTVWVNGLLLTQYDVYGEQNWEIVDNYTLRILISLTAGDTVAMAYTPPPNSGSKSVSYLPEDLPTGEIPTADRVSGSIPLVFVNSAQQDASNYDYTDTGVTLHADLISQLLSTDVVTLLWTAVVPGGNVVITQISPDTGTITEFIQDIDFVVNYTTGAITWLTVSAATAPVAGTSYAVSYVYFPKNLLTKLIGLVKPAPMQVIQRYVTTEGKEFNPYDATVWTDKEAEEDLIL